MTVGAGCQGMFSLEGEVGFCVIKGGSFPVVEIMATHAVGCAIPVKLPLMVVVVALVTMPVQAFEALIFHSRL